MSAMHFNQHELFARFVEARLGTKRPKGMSAKRFGNECDLSERDFGALAELAQITREYIAEQAKKSGARVKVAGFEN
ncbi:MAG: hypothetical protein R3D82_16100 [Xanthobacteraceae bacterium]